MINIKTLEQLEQRSCTAKQIFRIATTRKRFAVFTSDNLHLVNNLQKLIREKLFNEQISDIDIYQLK
jgi:hypothetical protein